MPLIVKPISAQLVKDADFFGKADPYCVIYIGNHKQKSSVSKDSGKCPAWMDTLAFNTNGEPTLRVQVWDHDTFSRDDLIGEGSVNLNQFYANPWRT